MSSPEAPSDKPKADAAKASVAVADDASSYVGTPAVGTSKAARAAGIASIGPSDSEINGRRRRLVWCAVTAFLGAWFIAFLRFFLPRTLFEPPTVFKIGYPSDYALGVDTKWQQKYRIWVDRTPDPCHGSGYDSEGVNFEGPAPRPMDRAHVELAPDGQIVVDTSRLFQWPKGQPSHFSDAGSFLQV